MFGAIRRRLFLRAEVCLQMYFEVVPERGIEPRTY